MVNKKNSDISFRYYIHIIENDDKSYTVLSQNQRNYGKFSTLKSARSKAIDVQKQNHYIILLHDNFGRVKKEISPSIKKVSTPIKFSERTKLDTKHFSDKKIKKISFAQ